MTIDPDSPVGEPEPPDGLDAIIEQAMRLRDAFLDHNLPGEIAIRISEADGLGFESMVRKSRFMEDIALTNPTKPIQGAGQHRWIEIYGIRFEWTMTGRMPLRGGGSIPTYRS